MVRVKSHDPYIIHCFNRTGTRVFPGVLYVDTSLTWSRNQILSDP